MKIELENNKVQQAAILNSDAFAQTIDLPDTNDLESFLKVQSIIDVVGLLYLDNEIRFCRVNGSKIEWHDQEFEFDWPHLKSARFFNESKELLLRREGKQLFIRSRTDSINEKGEQVVDSRQLLAGSRVSDYKGKEGWSLLKEDRGSRLIIPLAPSNQKNARACFLVRGYVNFTDNGQAGYDDMRIIDLKWMSDD